MPREFREPKSCIQLGRVGEASQSSTLRNCRASVSDAELMRQLRVAAASEKCSITGHSQRSRGCNAAPKLSARGRAFNPPAEPPD
jgi:hypothetical protein